MLPTRTRSLILRSFSAGPESNFATYYRGKTINLGFLTTCLLPSWGEVGVWDKWGHTMYTRVRLNLDPLSIVTSDTTFAEVERNPVAYGSAADCYSTQKACAPKGTFGIDLTKTPFKIASKPEDWTSVQGGTANVAVAGQTAAGLCGGNKQCGGGCSIAAIALDFIDDTKDSCASNPCQNGGQCVDGVDGFLCLCRLGYAGSTCTETCDDGAFGPDCSLECSCQNGGTCGALTGECYCPEE